MTKGKILEIDNTLNALDSLSQLLSISIYTAGIDQSIWNTDELEEIKGHALILTRKLTKDERTNGTTKTTT